MCRWQRSFFIQKNKQCVVFSPKKQCFEQITKVYTFTFYIKNLANFFRFLRVNDSFVMEKNFFAKEHRVLGEKCKKTEKYI